MTEKPTYTLDMFLEQIMKPMALNGVRSGMFDSVIFDCLMDEMYKDDVKMMDAIRMRRGQLERLVPRYDSDKDWK